MASACSDYKVNLSASQFGVCKCGFKKDQHASATNKASPPQKSLKDSVNQKKEEKKTEQEEAKVPTEDADPKKENKNESQNDKKSSKQNEPTPERNISKNDITSNLSKRYNGMKNKVSECFNLCKALISQLKMDSDLQEIETIFEKVSKKSFDAYFPVYGAMKAGKSTVLDCILESKVLPSRSLPMTTIPIKIGHRGTLTDPQLEIPNVDDWNKYLRLVASQAKPIDSNQDLESLRKNLSNEKLDSGTIKGPEISRNLFLLSDVVRIGLMNGITLESNNLPLSVGMLPTLLLKVPMFEDIIDEQNFYFIDTPGPDECRMSDSLQKINRVVLNESCGAMCVIPHHSVAASHTYEIMGPAVDSCIRDNKKLIVIINQIDSMNKMDVELPMVIDSVRQGLFTFSKVDILGISASRLKFARELQRETQRNTNPSDLLKSDAWKNYVTAKIPMTDKMDEVVQTAKDRTMEDLKIYNYDNFKKSIVSIYNDAQYLAMTSLLADMHKVVQRLREFVIQIGSCVQGEAEQLKKLKDLEVQLNKINDYRATIEGISTNLSKSLPQIFTQESANFERWAQGQTWIIVDRETNQRIEEAVFTNMFSVENWYREESDHKMLPIVKQNFENFSNKLRERVGDVVSLEWGRMNQLRDTISGAIGSEANSLLVKFSQPPLPRFQNPDFKFASKDMNIPIEQRGNQVVINTEKFTQAVLKYYIKKAKEHSVLVEKIFNDDLANVFDKFKKASAGFENQVKELQEIQKELEGKRQRFEKELKSFMEQANLKFNEATILFEEIREELGISFQ